MDFLKCKACGSFGMVPLDVRLLDADDDSTDAPDVRDYLRDSDPDDPHDPDLDKNPDEESRFYSCHVCGDNWLSIRRREDDGNNKVTFIHQMGVQPILRRVAYVQTDIVVNEGTVDYWEYFLDDDEVAEGEWMDKLADRRKVLKAICTN